MQEVWVCGERERDRPQSHFDLHYHVPAMRIFRSNQHQDTESSGHQQEQCSHAGIGRLSWGGTATCSRYSWLASAGAGLHTGDVKWIRPDRVGGDCLSPHKAASKARQDHLQRP